MQGYHREKTGSMFSHSSQASELLEGDTVQFQVTDQWEEGVLKLCYLQQWELTTHFVLSLSYKLWYSLWIGWTLFFSQGFYFFEKGDWSNHYVFLCRKYAFTYRKIKNTSCKEWGVTMPRDDLMTFRPWRKCVCLSPDTVVLLCS